MWAKQFLGDDMAVRKVPAGHATIRAAVNAAAESASADGDVTDRILDGRHPLEL